ncbi:MAG TPA: RibD family protein, partial [Burkholderiaceae bacterium]|nr:RibD family protein [Burkholderiaceae bacterium]
VFIYAAVEDRARRDALEARGATVILLPDARRPGKVDLAALLVDLGRREINELHIEAGERLNGSFIREGLVDEFVIYLAPKLIGQGRGMASFGPLTDLAQAVPLTFLSAEMISPDLRIVARITGRDQF